MEWSVLATPFLAFLGVAVAELVKWKSKKLDVASGKAIADCALKHSSNLEKVKGEFNVRLDDMTGILQDIKLEQTRFATEFKNLDAKVEKHNNVIERVYKLEQKVDDLEKKVG